MSGRPVAVVGGGYSGTLSAIHLARRGSEVVLIERADRAGRGAAYGTREPRHLLNVRASGMSAFAGEPDHFADWFAARGGRSDDFAQRRLYGAYLQELLGEAQAEFGARLRIVNDEAVDIEANGGVEIVRLAGGSEIEARAVILALGNLPPGRPAGIAPGALPPDAYVADPWRADLAAGLSNGDSILLIGTGLTAIDAALSLDAADFRGRILALSRRGLAPRAHGPASDPKIMQDLPPPRCLALLRAVRNAAAREGWQPAVDSLRDVTQQIWVTAEIGERSRFLRHLRPWWDVHRHRIAPAVAERIALMEREGRLDFAAGKIVSVDQRDGGLDVRWRPRGGDEAESGSVRRIVNCTGPSGNVVTGKEPLLNRLLARARARPDPLHQGLDVDPQCRVIDESGRQSPTLRAVGPLTRGIFWEMIAVPDLRRQVEAVADALSA